MDAQNLVAPANPARRRKNDPAGTRARILEAAFALFQDQGYNATSVQQIGAAAGVTGGALHHHFATKKALGLAVIRERVTAAVEEVWIAPMGSAPSAKQGIQAIFEGLADQLDAQGSVRGCPVNNLTLELAFADPEYRAELRALFDRWRQAIADRLRGATADAVATMVISAYSGATLTATYTP